jgi:DNA-binding NarL/FixJ family response regulator
VIETTTPEGVRILLVEDSLPVRRWLSLLLQSHEGWDVCGEIAQASQILQKTSELKPNVLVITVKRQTVADQVMGELRELLPMLPVALCLDDGVPAPNIRCHSGVVVISRTVTDVGKIIAAIEILLREQLSLLVVH